MANRRTAKRKDPQPKLTPDELERVELPPGAKDGNGTPPATEPATEADYLSVLLHQALDEQNALRRALVEKEQEIVNLRVGAGKREARIQELEITAAEAKMDAIRKERGLTLGRSINKNDETGEITWVNQPKRSEAATR